jgi:hypothetical protein
MSYDAFIKANNRNGGYWRMMQNPFDGRMPMVKFETMRPALKEKIQRYYGGDIYAHYAALHILQQLTPDHHAEEFYRNYRYDGNKELPPEYQARCCEAVKWLNFFIKAQDEKHYMKDKLGIKRIDTFWEVCIKQLIAYNVALPHSYGNLVSKPDSAIKKYRANSYASLISGHFGNKKAAKIGKAEDGYCPEREQQQLVVIKKLARLPMNLDMAQITSMANAFFAKKGWAQISEATVSNKIQLLLPEIAMQRKGMGWYNNNVAMQVKRVAPKYPTYFWTLDGWTVELAYQDEQGGKMRYDNRLVMVVVLDACKKYPVGWAIGERENTDLIRMALRNAIIHMQELFGAVYRPWQIQSDRYGLKNLTPFYNAVSHLHTPAAVGNAKSKIVEPYFKYLNKKYCQLLYNWTGFNINAKKNNQPNVEFLNKIKKQLPDKAGVVEQINTFMMAERKLKIADYAALWQAMPADKQVTLSPADCIQVFGKAHSEFNSITGLGLIATLEGRKMTYDSFDPDFRALQFSTKFKIYYEPTDLSQVVAVTEDGKRKFLLHDKMGVGMGFMNTTPEQLDYRQRIKDFNTARKTELVQQSISDDALLADIVGSTDFDLSDSAEATLKLMLTDEYGQQKEHLQDAKGLKPSKKQQQLNQAQQEWDEEHQRRIESQIDVNDYL